VLGPIALALFTLPFTESRTAMLVAAAIGLLFAWRRLSHALVLVGGCAALVVACTTLLLFQSGLLKVEASGLDSALEKVSRSGKIEEIYNLTGRTEVWEFVADQIARSPLIGYGYGCSRYVLARYPGSASDDFQPLHAHNLWLDVAVTTGLIGVLLYAAMIAQQAVGFVRRPAAFPDMALLLVLVAGNTEPVLFGAMPKTHTVLWMIALVWRGLAASVAPGAADAEGEGV
jgi:O-antigen ligase